MKKKRSGEPRLEIQEISDEDIPPEKCPKCSGSDYIRFSYYYRDIQDLGTPDVKRVVRYENIIWECKKCLTHFMIKHPLILERTNYMPGVLEYVERRVLEKGDSARRVLADLKELHNVDISISTINNWISKNKSVDGSPTDYPDQENPEEFSGMLSFDGTFRSVKAKKNVMQEDVKEPYSLHLTHLPDGRLVAYWQGAKRKKK